MLWCELHEHSFGMAIVMPHIPCSDSLPPLALSECLPHDQAFACVEVSIFDVWAQAYR